MREIRLYRKIYCITQTPNITGVTQSYSLISPFFLGANTYIAGVSDNHSNTIIESGLSITEESNGIFYVNLNPILYSSDITYDLVWFIKYTNNSPIKKLGTRFRIGINSISGEIELDIITDNVIDLEIYNTDIELLISNEDLDLNIKNDDIGLDSFNNNLEIDIL